MKKRYLRIVWSTLFLRYAAIYIAFGATIVFSEKWSLLLPFTIFFWCVCGILMGLEKGGSYTEFENADVVQRYFFIRLTIPVENVREIKMGYAASIIGKPRSIDLQFKRDDGSQGVRQILLHQFTREDVKGFVDELLTRNKNIKIDFLAAL